MFSQMVTVPILGTDLNPKDRFPSQFYHISIRGSESESEPVGNFCIVYQSESESGNVNKPLFTVTFPGFNVGSTAGE